MLWRSLVEKGYEGVVWKSVSVVVKCCSEVLWGSVVEKCCEGVSWRSVVEKCCREVL